MRKKLDQISDLPENNGGEVSSESLLNAAYSVWLSISVWNIITGVFGIKMVQTRHETSIFATVLIRTILADECH